MRTRVRRNAGVRPPAEAPATGELDLTTEQAPDNISAPLTLIPYSPDKDRETTRGTLARWLVALLWFTVGGALFFIALGRLDSTALTQSIFPPVIALVGTALGFYFGTQAGQNAAQGGQSGSGQGSNTGTPPRKNG